MRVVRQKNADIFRNLNALSNGRVAVGWFPEATYEDGKPVASVAEKHEYGNRWLNIPIRSFMRTTIHEKETAWVDLTAKLFASGLSVEQVMNQMGAVIRGDVQNKIVSISSPPNSQETIARKGFNDPLIDTKTMLRSISFKTGGANAG